MKVIGIGEKKTPSPFIASCNKFIYIEILHKESKYQPHVKATTKTTIKKDNPPTSVAKIDNETFSLPRQHQ